MYHILLVEDDRNIQTLIANYFTKKEKDVFAIEIASDGQTGLETARALPEGQRADQALQGLGTLQGVFIGQPVAQSE